MPAFLSAVGSFLLAHPELLVPVIASLLSFGLSFLTRALATSPRLAAAYSLLCKLFPDLTDPKALAADLWQLVSGGKGPPPPVLGVLFLCGTVAAASVVAPGCAWLRANEPAIVSDVTGGCEVVSLITSSGAAQALCLTLEDMAKLIEQLTAAAKAGNGVGIRYNAQDGSVITLDIDAAHVAVNRDAMMAAHARMSARGGK